jgi:diguanylate cyclase (GGDEF)-like protein/PAS domain S-box-containing protein
MFNIFMQFLAGARRRWASASQASVSEDQFRILAENSGDVLCRIGEDFIIKYASPAAQTLLGLRPDQIVGQSFKTAREQERATGKSGRATFRCRRSDGTTVWVEGTGRLLIDPVTGKPGDTVVVFRDVDERQHMEEQLAMLAATDGLTGLANRRTFDAAFERAWRQAQRDKAPVSLLLLDIDRFKGFNDQYGHQAGDDCLRAVAIAVKNVICRPGDLAARYGGEELAVILHNTDAAGATCVAEKIRRATELLHIPHVVNAEHGGVVTVSIGAATAMGIAGGTAEMPQGLLSSADHALYKAKSEGRNRVVTGLVLTRRVAA